METLIDVAISFAISKGNQNIDEIKTVVEMLCRRANYYSRSCIIAGLCFEIFQDGRK